MFTDKYYIRLHLAFDFSSNHLLFEEYSGSQSVVI